jgi:hypothetical protein
MKKDITLERVWEARRKIYADCGNDPQRLVEYYIEQQKQNPHRFPRKRRKAGKINGRYARKGLPAVAIQTEIAG